MNLDRWIIVGTGATVLAGLGGLMITLAVLFNGQLDRLHTDITGLRDSIATATARVSENSERLSRVEATVAATHSRLDRLDDSGG